MLYIVLFLLLFYSITSMILWLFRKTLFNFPSVLSLHINFQFHYTAVRYCGLWNFKWNHLAKPQLGSVCLLFPSFWCRSQTPLAVRGQSRCHLDFLALFFLLFCLITLGVMSKSLEWAKRTPRIGLHLLPSYPSLTGIKHTSLLSLPLK